ncbi:hypothetical protein PV325_011609 [Microctonus aethiopoides]|uniref:Large ribosomal subunit protein mL44 n=1 Tax=Microctonus aethiopoides TaxID=144406 RepID=A0AA39KKL1_9HYME|nr:hypothetical protein PV325_011609 [Microctonus aethiopoides]KAK0164935.1 hypothetical protein PV328_003499 [Microctonus aethiopoides]
MNTLRSCSRIITRVHNIKSVDLIGRRYIARWIRPVMIQISNRKKKLPVPSEPPRSSFTDWNYEAEVFAFNERLREKFVIELLTKALTHRSYVSQEKQKQREVGIEDPELDIEDNSEFIEIGKILTSKIIETYLSLALPRAPEECILALHDYLLSNQMLARSSSFIGTKDIILTEEYPPTEETMANTFLALVAALSESVDEVHAGIFVRDFLIASLAEKDLSEIWNPENPVQILNDILIKDGREPVEPRIITQSGISTLIPVYRIGLYSNKEYISSATEDNVNDAIKAAALNALHNIFNIATSSTPMKFNLVVNPSSDSMKNLPLKNWCTQNIEKLLQRN